MLANPGGDRRHGGGGQAQRFSGSCVHDNELAERPHELSPSGGIRHWEKKQAFGMMYLYHVLEYFQHMCLGIHVEHIHRPKSLWPEDSLCLKKVFDKLRGDPI